jgi:hypothetical protein
MRIVTNHASEDQVMSKRARSFLFPLVFPLSCASFSESAPLQYAWVESCNSQSWLLRGLVARGMAERWFLTVIILNLTRQIAGHKKLMS